MTQELKTILIAEDSDDNRTALKLMLKLHGYRVLEASDGNAAVETALEMRPDIILMDITLPGIDGLAATRRIRDEIECREIPVIVISAHDDDESRNRAATAGASGYCSKPIEFDRLKALIEKHLSKTAN